MTTSKNVQPTPAKSVSPTHEDIAALAYTFWLKGGCQQRHDKEDWLAAEAILLQSAEEALSKK